MTVHISEILKKDLGAQYRDHQRGLMPQNILNEQNKKEERACEKKFEVQSRSLSSLLYTPMTLFKLFINVEAQNSSSN